MQAHSPDSFVPTCEPHSSDAPSLPRTTSTLEPFPAAEADQRRGGRSPNLQAVSEYSSADRAPPFSCHRTVQGDRRRVLLLIIDERHSQPPLPIPCPSGASSPSRSLSSSLVYGVSASRLWRASKMSSALIRYPSPDIFDVGALTFDLVREVLHHPAITGPQLLAIEEASPHLYPFTEGSCICRREAQGGGADPSAQRSGRSCAFARSCRSGYSSRTASSSSRRGRMAGAGVRCTRRRRSSRR